jgi:hypothetical protein
LPDASKNETDSFFSKFMVAAAGSDFVDRFQDQAAPATEKAEGRRSEYLSLVVTSLRKVLTTDRLPPSGYPEGKEVAWLFSDSLENYRRRGGHPIYGENDIIYRFNSLGYRCPEFDIEADLRIVAVGCSYVLGQALPQAAVFHEVFAERLRGESKKNIVVWNLGRCGASNDYISRLLYLAVPRLDPHMVLINFTHGARREYVSVQEQLIHYNPAFEPPDEVTKGIFNHYAALCSPFDDQLNFFKNFKAVESLLAGRPWLFSHVRPQEFEPIAAHLDLSRFVGPLATVDRARDGGHPGPESHRRLAELYWAKFIELGGMGKMKA